MKIIAATIIGLALSCGGAISAPANEPQRVSIQVGDQPALPEDGCVYSGLGYSDRVFVNVPAGVYQCRAQHWYAAADVVAGIGVAPDDFTSVRTQAGIAGDGCIYAGLGYSDGAVLQTAAGSFLCKSHHWDRR